MSKDYNNDPYPPPPPPPSPYYQNTREGEGGENKRISYTERDYEEIYYHFDDYAQEIILANASKFLDPPEPAEHYEWEEVILDEVSQSEWEGMKKSLYFGAGCGLLSLGMLRWRRGRGGFFSGGGMMSRYASHSSTSPSSSMQSSARSSGGYTFDALPPPSSRSSNLLQHHHHQQQHSYHPPQGKRGGIGGLLFDTTLATLFGLGVSLLALESDAFYPTNNPINDEQQSASSSSPPSVSITPPPQWISPTIPLVPGRSIVADTLCQPLTSEFRKFPMQLWQSSNRKGIEGGYHNHMALYANSGWKGTKYYTKNENASVVSLGEHGNAHGNSTSVPASTAEQQPMQGVYEHLLIDHLQGFIINCERRARHENKLRKLQRGFHRRGTASASTMPIVIPDGGVDANEDLELDDIYYCASDDEEEEYEYGDGNGKDGRL